MFEKCRTCPDFEIYEGDDGKTAYCLQGYEIGEGCDVVDLESAIKHCEEVAKGHERNCELLKNESQAFAQNKKCANEHRQLAAWLRELRELMEKNK